MEWTQRARAMIEAREYRYISPVFEYRKDSREITRIVGAGLTNDPAYFMTAIASAVNRPQEESMDLNKLRQELGLPATASEGSSEGLCPELR